MAATRTQPDAFITARVGKVRGAMVRAKVPALLVTSFQDVSYLTGFEGDDSFVVVTPERVILISDSRYEEQIAREAGWVQTHIRTKGIMEETGKVIKKLKVKAVGVQDEAMTLGQRKSLGEHLEGGRGGKGKVGIKPVHEIVVELRHLKDEREIEILEGAIGIAEGGFEAVRGRIKEGMTENEIASLLVHEMRMRGASGGSFDTIVAAGANGSLPHYRPGGVHLRGNQALLVDWGARAFGYCSDLTRMIFLGEVPGAIKEIYKVVLEVQVAAIAAIGPGKTGKAVDKVARDIIKKAGYGDKFGHGLGHGIGRDIHEGISLSRLSKTVLRPGMVVTVEPGIYLPGMGGVRIEDDVLVTETGYKVLTHLKKDLESTKL